MSLAAAHINDAGITVLTADRLCYREPGFALLDDDGLATGEEAFRAARLKPRRIQNRYWSGLNAEALPDRRFQHLSAADLVSRQLESAWQSTAGGADRLVVAAPAYMSKSSLGLFLGVAEDLGLPIVALVDAAVAATRRRYENAVAVHVDLCLHGATLTRMAIDSAVQAESAAVVEGAGVIALYDAWIRMIAEAFVRQSRFDPLHTAETEQMLQDRLPEWLSAAAASEKVALSMEYRGVEHAAELESLTLLSAAAPIYQKIVSRLRALYRAEETPAIQMTDRAARMPGLGEMLKARVGGELFLLEPGATARGLLGRCRDLRRGDGGVSLIRQLPTDQSPVRLEAAETTQSGQPTHLLFGNTAWRIDSSPLSLGTQPVDGERWIDLGGDMPGVSRRHCTVQRENGQCVVRDHSRYGTFLNGHRLEASAVLQIGDLLRVGTPGYELRLIRTDESRGERHGT